MSRVLKQSPVTTPLGYSYIFYFVSQPFVPRTTVFSVAFAVLCSLAVIYDWACNDSSILRADATVVTTSLVSQSQTVVGKRIGLVPIASHTVSRCG